MTSPSLRFSFIFSAVCLFLITGPSAAHAQYVQIQQVSPTGAINPGTMITFVAAASGFTDPSYSVSDSFGGGTAGSIDKAGFFTWTPGIYDAGRHTLTVAVTDAQQHNATSTVNIIVTGNSVILSNLSPGPVITPGRTLTFSLVAPGFTTPSYAIYDSPSMKVTGANVNLSGSFSWIPGSDDVGTHLLTIVGSDAYGHTGQIQQTISVITPTVTFQTLRPGQNVTVGTPVSFTTSTLLSATTTYTVSDTFSAGTSTVTAAMLSSNGSFNWTPTATDIGTHLITVSATDGYNNTASSTLALWVTGASSTITPPPTPSVPPNITPSPSPSVPPSTSYIFTKNLVLGSKGVAVTELQKRLTTLGFYTGPITGTFGPLTSAAVKKFQAAHAIAKVGTVGPATRAALNK